MTIKNKIISFWKQVKLKSSDMFTLFRVGIGVKVPTHKLHIKDSKDPLKIEGLQNDTTDPDKYLTIDSSNIVKYRTGSEVYSDIGAATAQNITGATDSDVTITSDGEVIIKIDSDNDESNQKFKITNNADTEVAYISETGDFYLQGDITNTGSDSDLDIQSDGNMAFIIDRDDDETGQSFSFKNYTTEIANLDESGNLQIDGGLTTGSTSAINSSGLIQVANQSNITGVGTISSGTWQGTAIASAYLDSDTAHLNGTQTFTGSKTFQKPLIVDNDRSLAPGDGAAIHIDALDVTDNTTSSSGTATAFRHVSIENPRILASNALVTTTTASTVYIKGAPTASTNQTITNAYALEVAAGNVKLGADLLVEGDLQVNGSNSNINLNAGSDIILEADNAGGTGASSIQYKDSGGGNKIMLAANSDVVILSNRASNGTVQIRANTSTAGSGGEVTVVTVHDDKVDISKDLNVTGIITGKQREVYSQSFLDDLGNGNTHYLPWKDINEQTTIYQEEAAMIMPCDGRIVSVTIRTSSLTGSGNITLGVHSLPPGISNFTGGNWNEEETESLAVSSTDDYHVFHFAFDNAKHFESTEMVSISITTDADLGGTTYWYVTTVVEYDWSTFLGTTSAEIDSTP
jgi:hypothetical protein